MLYNNLNIEIFCMCISVYMFHGNYILCIKYIFLNMIFEH